MSIKERLYKLLINLSDIDNPIITEKTNLIDDLSFDSISMVSMIVEVENEFGIVLDDDDLDLEILSNVDSLLNMISHKTTEGK